MKALVINRTLKPSPEPSDTDAPARGVVERLRKDDVEVGGVRAVDLDIAPGVTRGPPRPRLPRPRAWPRLVPPHGPRDGGQPDRGGPGPGGAAGGAPPG
ncbi:hypothetical protein GCM10020295_73610 [Streptomyces cinereospinus]